MRERRRKKGVTRQKKIIYLYRKYIIKKPYIFYAWLVGFVVTISILISQISIKEYTAFCCTYQNGVIQVKEYMALDDVPLKKCYFYINRNDAVYELKCSEWYYEGDCICIPCCLGDVESGQKGFFEINSGNKPLIKHILHFE